MSGHGILYPPTAAGVSFNLYIDETNGNRLTASLPGTRYFADSSIEEDYWRIHNGDGCFMTAASLRDALEIMHRGETEDKAAASANADKTKFAVGGGAQS